VCTAWLGMGGRMPMSASRGIQIVLGSLEACMTSITSRDVVCVCICLCVCVCVCVMGSHVCSLEQRT
jgi:hypothetical protein